MFVKGEVIKFYEGLIKGKWEMMVGNIRLFLERGFSVVNMKNVLVGLVVDVVVEVIC